MGADSTSISWYRGQNQSFCSVCIQHLAQWSLSPGLWLLCSTMQIINHLTFPDLCKLPAFKNNLKILAKSPKVPRSVGVVGTQASLKKKKKSVVLITHFQQTHFTHTGGGGVGKAGPIICWALFLSHYRQSSNVCNAVLVRATKEHKRGFETSPFAVSFTQIRALDSKPKWIYVVHRRYRGWHQKKAQSHLINCSLSGTVFCSAQFSGKIWEFNVEAKRIPTLTHWNAAKARAPSRKTLSLLAPAQRRA